MKRKTGQASLVSEDIASSANPPDVSNTSPASATILPVVSDTPPTPGIAPSATPPAVSDSLVSSYASVSASALDAGPSRESCQAEGLSRVPVSGQRDLRATVAEQRVQDSIKRYW